MANNDLVKKKTIALTPEVHADLMRVVAAIQAKSGVNTTANDAVRVLLDKWEEATNAQAQPVIIKQSDGALYLQSATAHNHNFEMTHRKSCAMLFDSSDQAKEFLRQCGREVGDWIIEPV